MLEAVAAVVGSYVVGVSRAAATGELAHDDDGFSRAVRQIAPKLVDSVLESQRAQLKRRAEGLEILDSSFRRELVPVEAARSGSQRPRTSSQARVRQARWGLTHTSTPGAPTAPFQVASPPSRVRILRGWLSMEYLQHQGDP